MFKPLKLLYFTFLAVSILPLSHTFPYEDEGDKTPMYDTELENITVFDIMSDLTPANNDGGRRSLYLSDEKNIGDQEFLWIDIKTSDEANFTDPVEERIIEDHLYAVVAFFRENSGGQQRFNVTRAVYANDRMTRAICQDFSASGCESPIAVGRRAHRIIDPYNMYHRRIMNMYKRCSCMRFTGFASMGGRDSYVNKATAQITSHEVGHCNAAHHAAFETSAYGSSISVMGAYAGPPHGHFTVGAKYAFRWIRGAQVKHVARPENRFCVHNCTSVKDQVWLSSHDDLSVTNNEFSLDRMYAIKVYTESGDAVWIEYRTKYSRTNGVFAVWSTEASKIYDKTNEENYVFSYGPSQQMDFHSGTHTLNDASIPLNKTFVYDMDHVGASITVKEIDPINKKVLIEYEFLPTADTIDYAYGDLVDGGHIQCGDVLDLEVHEKTMFHLKMEQYSSLTIRTSNCMGDPIPTSTSSNAGMYIYTKYPKQLELNTPFDPTIGSAWRSYIECQGQGLMTNRIGDMFNKHNRRYESFSSSNYFLIYLGPGIHSNLTLSLTCGEPYYCTEGYYTDENNACHLCPSGTTSFLGTQSIDACYPSPTCEKLAVYTRYRARYNGIYTRGTGSFNGFPFYGHFHDGELVSVVIKSHGKWGIISAYEMERGWWSIKFGGTSKSNHPTGLTYDESPDTRIYCICDTSKDYLYNDERTGKCKECPYNGTAPSGSVGIINCVPWTRTRAPIRYPTSAPTKAPLISVRPTKSPTHTPSVSPTHIPSSNCPMSLFAPELSSNYIKFDETLTQLWGGVWRKHSTAHTLPSFYSGIHEWEIHVPLLRGAEHIFIGVQSNFKSKYRFPGRRKGYGFRGHGELWAAGKQYRKWGNRIAQGDTIKMVFDIDKGTLHYYRNDERLLDAKRRRAVDKLTGIPPGPYHLVVGISWDNRAKGHILSHTCL